MTNNLEPILEFIKLIEEKKLYFTLHSFHDDAIMILVHLPGVRWEVEFFENGTIEVERFVGSGVDAYTFDMLKKALAI